MFEIPQLSDGWGSSLCSGVTAVCWVGMVSLAGHVDVDWTCHRGSDAMPRACDDKLFARKCHVAKTYHILKNAHLEGEASYSQRLKKKNVHSMLAATQISLFHVPGPTLLAFGNCRP
jgi:hypothetical protein